MIKYSLVCEEAHGFDSWFADAAAYETQVEQHLVACPYCDTTKVAKAIMAPALIARRRSWSPPPHSPPPAAKGLEKPAADGLPMPQTEPAKPVVLLDERHAELRSMMQHIHRKIMEGTDDVGRRFPQEARRMHDGDIPHRSIRGEASVEDARALIEDGVQILPIPVLPEERN